MQATSVAEKILASCDLIVSSRRQRSWDRGHARGAHFVNRESRRGDFLITLDVLGRPAAASISRRMREQAMYFDITRSVLATITVNHQVVMPASSSLINFDTYIVIGKRTRRTRRSHTPRTWQF